MKEQERDGEGEEACTASSLGRRKGCIYFPQSSQQLANPAALSFLTLGC